MLDRHYRFAPTAVTNCDRPAFGVSVETLLKGARFVWYDDFLVCHIAP